MGQINYRMREEQGQKSLQENELCIRGFKKTDVSGVQATAGQRGKKESQKIAKSQNVPVCLLGVLFKVHRESVVGL